MTRLAVLALLFSTAAAASDSAPPAEAVTPLPVEARSELDRRVRALQLVQDRLAQGNDTAIDAQRAILEGIMAKAGSAVGHPFAGGAPDAPRLAHALLNGADPVRLAPLLQRHAGDPLVAGAAAYAQGRLSDALALLARAHGEAQAGAWPRTLRAQLDLTLGALMSRDDPGRAKTLLASARLAAPGTLIEEAALRREVLLRMDEPARMAALAGGYLRRFGQSPFAAAFVGQFAFALARAPAATRDFVRPKLDALLAPARGADRDVFNTVLARTSLVAGSGDIAAEAAAKVLKGGTTPSMLLSARLYKAAVDITARDPGSAATELHSLMRAPLSDADKDILRAAISVARELRRWPFDGPVAAAAVAAGPPPREAAPANSPMMDAAGALLDATDALLDE